MLWERLIAFKKAIAMWAFDHLDPHIPARLLIDHLFNPHRRRKSPVCLTVRVHLFEQLCDAFRMIVEDCRQTGQIHVPIPLRE